MKEMKIFQRKVPILAVIMAVLVIGTASAAVYFGFSGEITVESPFGEIEENPITYTETIVAGDSIQYVEGIPNDANNPILVELSTQIAGDPDGVTVVYYDADGIVLSDVDGDDLQELLIPPGGTIVGISAHTTPELMGGEVDDVIHTILTNFESPDGVDFVGLSTKDTNTWEPAYSGSGYVIYDVLQDGDDSDEFDFCIKAVGLATSKDYDLIYYADNQDRFVDPVGAPSMVIATITTGNGVNNPGAYYGVADGMLFLNSVADTGELPHGDDANGYAVYHDYRGAPDFYTDATGAKLWLVPSGALVDGELAWAGWDTGVFVYETGLVNFDIAP